MLTFKGPLTPDQASGLAYLVLSFVFFPIVAFALGGRVPIPFLFWGSCIFAGLIARRLRAHWQRFGAAPDLPRATAFWKLGAFLFTVFAVHETIAYSSWPPASENLARTAMLLAGAVGFCGFAFSRALLSQSLWRFLWWALPAVQAITAWIHLERFRGQALHDRSLPEFPMAWLFPLLASYALYRYSHGPLWTDLKSEPVVPPHA